MHWFINIIAMQYCEKQLQLIFIPLIYSNSCIHPIKQHLEPHASQLRRKAQHPEHTLRQIKLQPQQLRNMKQTIFHNTNYTTNSDITPDTTTLQTVETT